MHIDEQTKRMILATISLLLDDESLVVYKLDGYREHVQVDGSWTLVADPSKTTTILRANRSDT